MKRSPHHNWHVPTLLVLLAISMSLAFVGGCTSNAVAPSTDNPNLSTLDWLNSSPATGQADRCPISFMTDRTVSGLIGPKGGLLQAKLDGSVPTIFRFPAGALKVETLITIRVYREQMRFGTLEAYDCGPDGTVFDLPVEVTKPMPPGKDKASLFYFNEESMQWELQETAPVEKGAAKLHIYHFSKYGIS